MCISLPREIEAINPRTCSLKSEREESESRRERRGFFGCSRSGSPSDEYRALARSPPYNLNKRYSTYSAIPRKRAVCTVTVC